MLAKEEPTYYISCVHLAWIFELCRNHQVHLDKITSESSYALSHLEDESQSITWSTFADIASNVGKFFDEVDLRDSGQRSWRLAPLQTHGSIGRILFDAKDQYLATYGTGGYCARSFPIETSVEQPSANRLIIRLTMKEGARPCYPFFTILAGQMEGLTVPLGLRRASVTMKPVHRGASYTIDFTNRGFLVSATRRIAKWFTASRMVTREFAILRESYEKLIRDFNEANNARHSAELAAAEIDDNYRLIGSNIHDVIWTVNPTLRIGNVTPSIERVLGFSEDEFLTTDLESLLLPDDLETLQRTTARLFRTCELEPVTLEFNMKHRSGDRIWMELKLVQYENATSSPVVVCIARDITQARQIEGKLTSRATDYRTITDSAIDGIITFDRDNVITYANPATTEIFGYSSAELTDMNIKEIMPEALGDTRLRELYLPSADVSATGIAVKGLRQDKSLIPLEVSFASHELNNSPELNNSHEPNHSAFRTCIIRDVSSRTRIEQERQSLQAQLQAAQKMDSVGQLSGGIAHDFNNLLVAILGYTDLAMQSDTRDSLAGYLEEIRRAGERGTDMTQKLLAFSRRQIIEPRIIEANELIDGVREMLARLLPRNIEIVFSSEVENLHLLADVTQLEQVLINLSVNARDAMPGGGRLRISLSEGPLESRPGNYLILEIDDSGVGMDADIQKRIFEPFYTTKPEGRGTGLGLAVVFGIVNQHQGFIKVDSLLGEGTCFTVYLPVADDIDDASVVSGKSIAAGGQETILIVEDNEQVRNLARLILAGAGYQVLEAVDGRDGLETFTRQSPEIDLVLMDVVMPNMGGREAAEYMMQHQPDIKIVFTTGYAPDSIHARFIAEENRPFIPKPFGTDLLRTHVRSMLDGTFVRTNTGPDIESFENTA